MSEHRQPAFASNAQRYVVDMIIGPCEKWEAQDLAEAIASLRQFSNVGAGAVSITVLEDDDVTESPLDADFGG